jgi:hypothetical protein
VDIIERLKIQLIRKGIPPAKAENVAFNHLYKSGVVDREGKLTSKGVARSRLTPAQRAYQRAGRSPSDGSYYDPYDNKIKEG